MILYAQLYEVIQNIFRSLSTWRSETLTSTARFYCTFANANKELQWGTRLSGSMQSLV
jgi:hypothetical protein